VYPDFLEKSNCLLLKPKNMALLTKDDIKRDLKCNWEKNKRKKLSIFSKVSSKIEGNRKKKVCQRQEKTRRMSTRN